MRILPAGGRGVSIIEHQEFWADGILGCDGSYLTICEFQHVDLRGYRTVKEYLSNIHFKHAHKSVLYLSLSFLTKNAK